MRLPRIRLSRNVRAALPVLLRWMIVGVIAELLIMLIWVAPKEQVRGIRDPARALELETQARQALATIVGGAAVLIGLFFTFRQLRAFESTVSISLAGQIAERFSRAIDQLASPQLESRLGAIYSFEQIARESGAYFRPIMEILTTFLREHSTIEKLPPYPATSDADKRYPTDLQAIVTVLGRRQAEWPKRLNLGGITLRHASLRHGDFEDCTFEYSLLEHADLRDANLRHANLCFAHLEEAQLEGANLHGAEIAYAILVNTKAGSANFRRADASNSLFKDAVLAGTDFTEARLDRAMFFGAFFGEANLDSASLAETKLFGADLSSVQHLTQKQLHRAWTDTNTKLPKKIKLVNRGHYHREAEPKKI